MMGYGAGLGFGFGWLWMLGLVLLVVGVVVLIAWLVGRTAHSAQPTAARPAGQEALETLQLRFARGDISRDDYLAVKQTLEMDR
jgi:putative membrane protein